MNRRRFILSALLAPFAAKAVVTRAVKPIPLTTAGSKSFRVASFHCGPTLEYDENGQLISRRVVGSLVKREWANLRFESSKGGPADRLVLEQKMGDRKAIVYLAGHWHNGKSFFQFDHTHIIEDRRVVVVQDMAITPVLRRTVAHVSPRNLYLDLEKSLETYGTPVVTQWREVTYS